MATAATKGCLEKIRHAAVLAAGIGLAAAMVARPEWFNSGGPTTVCAFLVGLSLAWGAGEFLSGLMANAIDRSSEKIEFPRAGRLSEKQWKALTDRRSGGVHVGRSERLLFFGAFLAGAWPLVIAWLVFKVASNWQGAYQINKLPEWLVEHKDPSVYLARSIWSSRVLVSFVAGTALNVAIALGCAGLSQWLGMTRVASPFAGMM